MQGANGEDIYKRENEGSDNPDLLHSTIGDAPFPGLRKSVLRLLANQVSRLARHWDLWGLISSYTNSINTKNNPFLNFIISRYRNLICLIHNIHCHKCSKHLYLKSFYYALTASMLLCIFN